MPDPCHFDVDPDPDPGTDPAIFVIDLQEANKKLIFLKKFSCVLLFEGTFTLQKKGRKEVTKQ